MSYILLPITVMEVITITLKNKKLTLMTFYVILTTMESTFRGPHVPDGDAPADTHSFGR